jgi:endo-1,3(4)-beta-glucanase
MRKLLITIIVIGILLIGGYLWQKSSVSLSYSPEPTPGYTNVTVTHSWYSSLFYSEFGEPLFAYPLSLQLKKEGIELGYPGISTGVTTVSAPHTMDLFLQFDTPATSLEVIDVGEWDVRVQLTSQAGVFATTRIIKGNPSVYLNSANQRIQIINEIKQITVLGEKALLVETHRGNRYLIESTAVIETSSRTLAISLNSGDHIITLIPAELTTNSSDWPEFRACAIEEPTESSFDIKQISDSMYEMDLRYLPTQPEKFFFTIWPHQAGIDNAKVLGSYATIRGNIQLICSEHLRYQLSTTKLPLDYAGFIDIADINDEKRDLLKTDVDTLLAQPTPTGVYFKGKYIKNLVDLWQLSKITRQNELTQKLQSKLIDELTYEIQNFSFNAETELLTHAVPEFGQEKGNDHHFQYSYWIYSYTKLFEEFDPRIQPLVLELMNEFVREGLPGLFADAAYPNSFRFLDIYEGHSWADAQAVFKDGNNQESSSEALFYWYSLWLWSKSQSNLELTRWSEVAFFHELKARNYYWFFSHNDPVASRINKPMVSLVWGGKLDYTTWFSPEEDKIFGIQLLPINPSSFVSLNSAEQFPDRRERIDNYYDAYFANNSGSFQPYYSFYKLINLPRDSEQTLPLPSTGTEFYSKTLYKFIADYKTK